MTLQVPVEGRGGEDSGRKADRGLLPRLGWVGGCGWPGPECAKNGIIINPPVHKSTKNTHTVVCSYTFIVGDI